MYWGPQAGQLSFLGWMDKRLQQLSNLINYRIPINYFQDFVDQRDLSNTQTFQTIKETKKIMKVVVVSAAEAERVFSLMNSIATNKEMALLIENISHHMTLKALEKSLKQIGMQHHSSNCGDITMQMTTD
jgi:putative NIF3 family GTP cyclohydrolase 1 type 2